jgi:hypothetical protein
MANKYLEIIRRMEREKVAARAEPSVVTPSTLPTPEWFTGGLLCAQCGEPGPLNLVTAVNYQVHLHGGMCERLWLAGHPPAVTALSSVAFNGVMQ